MTEYGASYKVISSEVRVTAKGRLVDLGSGDLLWAGEATASTAESQNQSSSGLLGVLISAVVNQILNTEDEDLGYRVAGVTMQRLLAGGHTDLVACCTDFAHPSIKATKILSGIL